MSLLRELFDGDEDEVFPWEIIEVGVPRGNLLASYREARRLIAERDR